MVRIDLHSHSDRSDGTQPPAEVVRRAHRVGLDVLALTDHDTAEGWPAAAEAARETGVRLVRGMELSCRYAGYGVHLLAYLPDPTYPPLAEELARILTGRDGRLPLILQRLHDVGVEITEEDVRRVSGASAAAGRPHVADALVALGVVADRNEAFNRFLGPQGPAYVTRYAPDVRDMIGWVREAGGVSVVAHPWAARHHHEALDEPGLAELREAGMAGVEVDHLDHDPATRERLRALARGLGLLVTGSSDHHGEGKVGHELGCHLTSPGDYDRLVELAERAGAASGRTVPAVVGA